jgi:MFS superfamily sulfate permease-like transporter
MGWVAAFVSTPVMRGFIEGLVYVTIIGKVPHLLGIPGVSGNFFSKIWNIIQQLPGVSLAPVLTLSLIAMLRPGCRRHWSPWSSRRLLSAYSAEN